MHTSGVLHTIARQCVADSKRWFPETAEALPFTALALCGEVGELANIVKKVARGSLNIKDAKTRNDLVGEMADVFTYLELMAGILGVDLELAYNIKRIENERRFGQNGKSA